MSPGAISSLYIDVLYNLCQKEGYQLLGYKYGYQGLIDNKFSVLTNQDVQNIFSVGGSVLKTSRCDAFMKVQGKKKAAQNLIDNNIDYTISKKYYIKTKHPWF